MMMKRLVTWFLSLPEFSGKSQHQTGISTHTHKDTQHCKKKGPLATKKSIRLKKPLISSTKISFSF